MAIDRIRALDPIQNGISDEPYFVAYSGGKDSDALRVLFELSGVKYDLWHNHTTVDAPETVNYIRTIPGLNISYPRMSMWELILKNKYPPTRLMRYCCVELKERGGKGRIVVTGVRWAESNRRKHNRGSLELQSRKRSEGLILNADNAEDRRMVETCMTKQKRVLNPIIDWETEDIWELLNHHGIKSNPLYQEGWLRVGCVGCPMAGPAGMKREFERWPKYKEIYIRTFKRMLDVRIEIGKPCYSWKTGQDVYDWWVTGQSVFKKEAENA